MSKGSLYLLLSLLFWLNTEAKIVNSLFSDEETSLYSTSMPKATEQEQ